MNKQISLLFTLLLCSINPSWSQEPNLKEKYLQTFTTLSNEKKQALNEKDYAKVELKDYMAKN